MRLKNKTGVYNIPDNSLVTLKGVEYTYLTKMGKAWKFYGQAKLESFIANRPERPVYDFTNELIKVR